MNCLGMYSNLLRIMLYKSPSEISTNTKSDVVTTNPQNFLRSAKTLPDRYHCSFLTVIIPKVVQLFL